MSMPWLYYAEYYNTQDNILLQTLWDLLRKVTYDAYYAFTFFRLLVVFTISFNFLISYLTLDLLPWTLLCVQRRAARDRCVLKAENLIKLRFLCQLPTPFRFQYQICNVLPHYCTSSRFQTIWSGPHSSTYMTTMYGSATYLYASASEKCRKLCIRR